MIAVGRTARICTIVTALLVLPLVAAAPAGAQDRPPVDDPDAVDPAPTCAPPFTDVDCGHPFHTEIAWLTTRGLADGYPDGSFGPGRVLTRKAVAALLYRSAGEPAGPFPDPGFTDVTADDPFAVPIWWLVDAGLADGFADGTFGPERPMSRQATASVLHRRAGSPGGAPDPGFTDVPADDPFGPAIWWLADVGATTGAADGGFHPRDPVSRQTSAALLYRLALRDTIDVATADRCEFLDPTRCALVFPSDHFTVADPTTDTGRRLALDPASMPRNKDGVPIDPTELNRNDGFSPGSMVVARVPGLDLGVTGAPTLDDLSVSLDPDSPMVLVDADTGQRHPFWAELDRPDLALPDDKRALMLRPAVNLEEGHRYIVALRRLRDADGQVIEPNDVFRSYREGAGTGIDVLEARRPAMDSIFASLEAAGVDRDDLFLAWDFTVASERNLSERLLTIRDDAFADLGDAAPPFTVTSVQTSTPAENADLARRVEGTFEVPLYLTGDGSPGSSFHWGPDGLPTRNGDATITARFWCGVPHAATAATPARISLYGHGLLGEGSQALSGYVRSFGQAHDIVFCGTDFIGMADEDVPNVVSILKDFSSFHTLADRVQQGVLNFLFLGRLMQHADGFGSHPAFQDGGVPLLDTDELFYDGNSQGGIIGGAVVAVSTDVTRAVLGVPAINYSTLLRRSSDWPQFALVMSAWYPDRLDQTLILAAGQNLWDRAEGNGYAHHLTDDPYPGTPAHQVLLHVAFADYQVSMYAADVMARTIGARLRQPALGPGRHPASNPFVGLDPVPVGDEPWSGSAMVYWDSGNDPPPLINRPPADAQGDPHGKPRNQPAAQAQKSAFFDGTFVDTCGPGPCLAP